MHLVCLAGDLIDIAADDAGQKQFTFEEVLGDGDMKAMMIQAVAEMLDRRSDLEEVRDHYLGIAGQYDLTVTAKPTQEMKLYCPLEIQAEPQIYETDWDAPYDDDLEVIPSSCACGCEDEINAAIQKYSESNEKYRGLMIYVVKVNGVWFVLDTQAGGFLDYNYGFTEVIDKYENHVADGSMISDYSYEELYG